MRKILLSLDYEIIGNLKPASDNRHGIYLVANKSISCGVQGWVREVHNSRRVCL